MEVKHAGVGCHVRIASERLSESPHIELKGIGWCLKYAMLKLMTKNNFDSSGWSSH